MTGPPFATLVRLAKPRIITQKYNSKAPPDFESHNVFVPATKFKVPIALRRIQSRGLIKLSEPRMRREKFIDTIRSAPAIPAPVSRKALRYRASPHIRRLATPRKYTDAETRERPFKVAARALRQPTRAKVAVYQRLAEPRKEMC